MITAIANAPTKEVTVNYTVETVKAALDKLSKSNTFNFLEKNDILNTYRFQSTEFLSAGAYYTVFVSIINDTQTKIKVEAQRLIGAFDQVHEVAYANQKIDKLFNEFSFFIANPTADPTTHGISTKSYKTYLILCILLGWLGIHRWYLGKYITGPIFTLTLGLWGFGWLFDILMLLGKVKDGDGLIVK